MINKKTFFVIIIFLLITSSCESPELVRNEIIYSNNFEKEDLEHIDGGIINEFNNTKVIGFYNKDGFNLNLNKIGGHDYITVSFDLYIHGTWDGNVNGFEKNDKADKWILELRPDMDLYQDKDFSKFVTTFSNSPCYSNWCKRQSYPESFPFENNPYSGANKINLPRTCEGYWGGKTAIYKIEKTFKHKGDALMMRFYDELYQPNAIDFEGNSSELCDESWSMDNIKIRALSYR
jgi:hypothetical protein